MQNGPTAFDTDPLVDPSICCSAARSLDPKKRTCAVFNRRPLRVASLVVMLCALGWGGSLSVAHGDEDHAEAVVALPRKALPVPPRMALPERDCMTCPGPPASEPCFHTHRGFLYYGTYPWDDDPVNGFDDCPRGQCGYPGAALSLGWIRMHEAKGRNARHGHRPTRGCRTCNTVPHYFHGTQPPLVAPQPEEFHQ